MRQEKERRCLPEGRSADEIDAPRIHISVEETLSLILFICYLRRADSGNF